MSNLILYNYYQKVIVPKELAGKRIDQVLTLIFKNYSRSKLKKYLIEGKILINCKIRKPKSKMIGGEVVEFRPENTKQRNFSPNAIDLNINYEDEEILVIDKPSNLVVHPGAGNSSGTLLNGLLSYKKLFLNIPRSGIVHRLDKDTTGLMVIAKTINSYYSLINQLSKRLVTRKYHAIVKGIISEDIKIETKIGRNQYNRLKMAVQQKGKEAITQIKVFEKYREHTNVICRLETGRTHQIRVHMNHINKPIVGDQTYNKNYKISKKFSDDIRSTLNNFKRQALHAYKLAFIHPSQKNHVCFTSEIPDDMNNLIKLLKNDYNKKY